MGLRMQHRSTIGRVFLGALLLSCNGTEDVVFLVSAASGGASGVAEPLDSGAARAGRIETGREDAGEALSPPEDAGEVAPTVLTVVSDPIRVREGEVSVSVGISLVDAPSENVSARYELVGNTARADCQNPDFTLSNGEITWGPGQRIANLQVQLRDDSLAETDEVIEVSVAALPGQGVEFAGNARIVIEDDDRSQLIDAARFGLVPGSEADQSAVLQSLVDQAYGSGRGVVVLATGEYVISSVQVPQGITLSGHGATLLRPAGHPPDVVTLELFASEETPVVTLVEGLQINGNRDQQGGFTQNEAFDAHLIRASGLVETGTKLHVAVEGVQLFSGTGDGLEVGPETVAQICAVDAYDLWRDAVGARGGGVVLDLEKLTAGASLGTTGLVFAAERPGFEDTRRIEVTLREVQLDSGDVEIRSAEGSVFDISELYMSEPPFRLQAEDSTVRISQSRLSVGIPSERHNMWVLPKDVRVTDSVLVSSELVDETGTADEQDRVLAQVFVDWTFEDTTGSSASGNLLFERCQFEVENNVEPSDQVYAIRTLGEGSSITVTQSSLGARMTDWFAPECSGCLGP